MLLELIEKIGEGALADVFAGRLGTPGGAKLVTVRRLHRVATETPEVLDGLRSSSQVMAALSHEHVTQHLGFASANGEHYWVSERVAGFDLSTVLKRLASREVRITPVRALRIGLDLLLGLAALHDKKQLLGVVGPRNVLVGYDGIARLDGAGFDAALFHVPGLAQKGWRERAAYAAPETAQGRTPAVQADVFSSAAILYHLLTGQPPLGDDRRGGMAVSVRHAAIEPPSKIDRSLPYSCDAVFLKALSTAPSGRHDSVEALHNAANRLRAAILSGPDEGRKGVQEFISALYPNEAIVAGQPGTEDRPAISAGIELNGLIPPADGPGLAEDEDTPPDGAMQMDDATPPDGTIPLKAAAHARAEAEAAAPDEKQPEAGEDGAMARIAAWEATYGEYGCGPDAQPQPPPLPAKPPPPRSRNQGPEAGQGDNSIVVDWDGLGSEGEREATHPEVDLEKAKTPDDPIERPVDKVKTPIAPVVRPKEKARTPIVVREPMVVDDDDEGQEPDQEVQVAPTRPDLQASPQPAPSGGQQIAKLVIIGLIAAVVGAVGALAISGSLGDDQVQPEAGRAEVGFLTLMVDGPVKVTLNGEFQVGNRLPTLRPMPAGEHRIQVDAASGGTVFDEVIRLNPGETKEIRIVLPASPGDAASPPVSPTTTVKNEPRPTGKKRTRKRKRRKRRSRSFR